jgi:hypothetical protein
LGLSDGETSYTKYALRFSVTARFYLELEVNYHDLVVSRLRHLSASRAAPVKRLFQLQSAFLENATRLKPVSDFFSVLPTPNLPDLVAHVNAIYYSRYSLN